MGGSSPVLAFNSNRGVWKKISKARSHKGKILRQVYLRLKKTPTLPLGEWEVVNNKTRDIEFRSSAKITSSLQHRLPIIIEDESPTKFIDEFANVSLRDLEVLTTLGVGGFGRVKLALIRGDSTRTFALKQIKKAKIVRLHQEHHILSEKQIMNQVNSDFILKLHKTFKDEKYVYMLIESCLGGDLFTILQREKRLKEPAARFYIACVVKAFEHLHSKNIIYWDLKPENLLIDHQGYVKVADFGFARKLDLDERTKSTCGTPEYMAPEVILGKEHDVRCDYWSLGVLVFELLSGRSPFNASVRDPRKIYDNILKGFKGRKFPAAITLDSKALILSLCRDESEGRLSGASIGQMVPICAWFRGFDWKALTTRTMAPPNVPEIKSLTDTSNFEYFPPDNEIPADDFSGWDADF